MRVAAIVITKNRLALFQQTITTLLQARGDYFVLVVDAGSTEPNRAWLAAQIDAGTPHLAGCVPDDSTSFHVAALRGVDHYRALGVAFDALLLSGDDYAYRPDWYTGLTTWLGHLPPTPAVSHVACVLEPAFTWAAVTGTLDSGGVRALCRDTVPGCNWAFRADHWAVMEPYYREHQHVRTFDHQANGWARSQGRLICALDLSVHVGAMASTQGNGSYHGAPRLDVSRYGLRRRNDPVSPFVTYEAPA